MFSTILGKIMLDLIVFVSSNVITYNSLKCFCRNKMPCKLHIGIKRLCVTKCITNSANQ